MVRPASCFHVYPTGEMGKKEWHVRESFKHSHLQQKGVICKKGHVYYKNMLCLYVCLIFLLSAFHICEEMNVRSILVIIVGVVSMVQSWWVGFGHHDCGRLSRPQSLLPRPASDMLYTAMPKRCTKDCDYPDPLESGPQRRVFS